MVRKIKIKCWPIEAVAELNDTRTAQVIWEALPIEARANLWGEEVYFAIPLSLELEAGQELVNAGDLGYWPEGNAFCIFFGPTPISRGNEIRPASAVTVFGRIIGEATISKQVASGAKVTIEKEGIDQMAKRPVYYFDEPGKGNTQLVLEAVAQRLEDSGIKKVVVASTSGETAVKFARNLKDKAELVCVSEAPYRREWGESWPCLKEKFRKELDKLGVAIIDNAPYIFHSSVLDSARWPDAFPERLVKETLYCFGQGMKVAVEVVLTGVSCGYVIPFEDVIGVGGSESGADTAIVLRATYPACLFDKDPTKRLEIKEIIAMSVSKKWWD